MIDVIVPVYNAESYIEETLKGIVNQGAENIGTIIVVNDGSTDSSSDVIQKFIEKHPHFTFQYIEQINSGHAQAVNNGSKNAKSEFLAFCDSDDVWKAGKIEKQLALITKYGGNAVIYCDYELIDENSNYLDRKTIDRVIPCLRGKVSKELLKYGNRISSSNSGVLLPRKLFMKYMYNFELVACEDWDLWIKLSREVPFDFCKEKLVRIRVHASNQSSDRELMFTYDLKVLLGNLNSSSVEAIKLIFIKIRKYFSYKKIYYVLIKLKTFELLKNYGFKNKTICYGIFYVLLSILRNILIKAVLGRRVAIVRLKGGFGNQMFQYAFGLFFAHKYNVSVYFDSSYFTNQPKGVTKRKLELDKFVQSFGVLNLSEIKLKIIKFLKFYYREANFRYYDADFVNLNKNLVLDGYWQSYRYVDEVRDILREKLTLEETSFQGKVAVHIRRGDYVTNQAANKFHGVLGEEYYLKSIELLRKKVKGPVSFDVFSDDILWVKENMFQSIKEKYNINFIEEGSFITEFKNMLQYNHFVIANSTFSWWAAYLSMSNDKVVIAPKSWFHDDEIDASEIFPPDWLLV